MFRILTTKSKLVSNRQWFSKFPHLRKLKEENLLSSLKEQNLLIKESVTSGIQELLKTPGLFNSIINSDDEIVLLQDNGIQFREALDIRTQLLALNAKFESGECRHQFSGKNFTDVVDVLRQGAILSKDFTEPNLSSCQGVLGLEDVHLPLTSRIDHVNLAVNTIEQGRSSEILGLSRDRLSSSLCAIFIECFDQRTQLLPLLDFPGSVISSGSIRLSGWVVAVVLNLDDKLPGSTKNESLRDLVYTGLLYAPSELIIANEPALPIPMTPKQVQPLLVSLPPFFVMCSRGPAGLPESFAHSDIANLIFYRPNNLWEEFSFRYIILRSHLFRNPEAVSPLSLFEPNDRILSTPNFLGNVKVDLSKPFNRVLLTFDTPPSHQELCEDSELSTHLWTPNSLRESGIDALLFLREKAPRSKALRFVCIGIQCKYSKDGASTKLSLSDIQGAQTQFLKKMKDVGWEEKDCGLVVLALRNSNDNVSSISEWSEVGGGIAVVGAEGIKSWLGESMHTYIRGLHHQSISHLPRMDIKDKSRKFRTPSRQHSKK